MDVATTNKLFRDFDQEGWNLYPVFQQKTLVAEVPKPRDALKVVRLYTDLLAVSAAHLGFHQAVIKISKGKSRQCFYSIPARMAALDALMSHQTIVLEPSNKLIEIYSLSVSPALWQEMGWFLNHPNQAGGIVRVDNNQQVAMSYANAKKDADYTAGAGVQKAVSWKRSDFWHPGDLADFDQDWRQKLEPNNPNSWIEFTWRSFDPELGISSSEGWIEFNNRYKLLIDEQGVFYHVSHNLGMRIIQQPLSI